MGGKGSGGSRPGSGRKRKGQQAGALTGSRRAKARRKNRNSSNQTAANQNGPAAAAPLAAADAPAVNVNVPVPPGNITLEELDVWNELAPLAFAEGTLTNGTRHALRDLCQLRVLRERLLRQTDDIGYLVPGASGGTYAANPLLARLTTLSQRVEAGMLRFKLSPMGKEIEVPQKPEADPFAEFDGAPAGTGDGETIN